ncbi:MAG: tyrosine-type recombinase/integrase [Eubacterium sp.]|nr:tyrosine-type recombinase/integrase [Eubacterium sp.]
MLRKEILKQHPYKIRKETYRGDKVRYCSYIIDPVTNRKTVIKKTRLEDLEDAIVDTYRNGISKITMEGIYPEWLDYKAVESSQANANMLNYYWGKYLKGTPVTKRQMSSIHMIDLKTACLDIISKNNMTRKQFSGMKSVLSGLYQYAAEKELVPRNIVRDIRISTRHFRKADPKPVEQQIFPEELAGKLIEAAKDTYRTGKLHNTGYLAIALNFWLGLRVGELVALRQEDIDWKNHKLHVCRSEVKSYDKDLHRNGSEISDYLKCGKTERYVVLVPEAEEILREVIRHNMKKGQTGGYLFIRLDRPGEPVSTECIGHDLHRLCDRLNTEYRGVHGIRRTYATKLFDGGLLNLEQIRLMLGHEDSETTRKYYIKEAAPDNVDVFNESLRYNA